MVRAGDVPLDRAHAHARWAERYGAQGDTLKAAAHFGRAVHYAQAAHAFGAEPEPSSKRAREAVGDIVVGRWEGGWEDGKEVWTALFSERAKRKRMQQVLHGHGGTMRKRSVGAPAAFVGSLYRVLPGMLDKLYASESSGTKDSVHSYTGGTWYIARCTKTGFVCLVPARLATDAGHARLIVDDLGREIILTDYTLFLKKGLLIVQDQRRGCVRVKRNGVWEHATKIETFTYYDFLLRYPAHFHNYSFEKEARRLDEDLRKSRWVEGLKRHWKSTWTTIPQEYAASEGEDLKLTIKRDQGGISIGHYDDFGKKMPDPISDWAWRHTERQARE
jgi:hypothetical protein